MPKQTRKTRGSSFGEILKDARVKSGLTNCGCPISYKAVDDLEKIRPYEPNVVKAAWNIFGKSYEYRRKYNEFKTQKMAEEKAKKAINKEQVTFEEV